MGNNNRTQSCVIFLSHPLPLKVLKEQKQTPFNVSTRSEKRQYFVHNRKADASRSAWQEKDHLDDVSTIRVSRYAEYYCRNWVFSSSPLLLTQASMQASKQASKHASKQAGKQAGRQPSRQAGRQASKQSKQANKASKQSKQAKQAGKASRQSKQAKQASKQSITARVVFKEYVTMETKKNKQKMEKIRGSKSSNKGLISADRSNTASLLRTIPCSYLSRLQRI